MNAIIPRALDVDALLNTKHPKFKPRRSKLLFVLDAITYAEGSSKDQLRSSVMKMAVSDYQKYLNLLVAEGVIFSPNSGSYLAPNLADRYNREASCKLYRYTERYSGAFKLAPLEGTIPYDMQVNGSTTMIKGDYMAFSSSMASFSQGSSSSLASSSSTSSSSSSYMCELFRGTIDNPHLMKFQPQWFDRLLELYESDQIDRRGYRWFGRLIAQSRKWWFYSVSDRCGRVTTTVNMLPRAMRQDMIIAGDSDLAMADVRACIPFLALRVLRNAGADAGELTRWQHLLEDGDVYSEFAARLNTHVLPLIDRSHPFTRDDCKVELLKVFFASNRGQFPARTVFTNWFPSIHATLTKLRKGDHKKFACMIFREESDLIVRTAGQQLSSEGIPAFSIHDGLLIRRKDAARVQAVMESVLSNAVGARAVVTVEAVTEAITIDLLANATDEDFSDFDAILNS